MRLDLSARRRSAEEEGILVFLWGALRFQWQTPDTRRATAETNGVNPLYVWNAASAALVQLCECGYD